MRCAYCQSLSFGPECPSCTALKDMENRHAADMSPEFVCQALARMFDDLRKDEPARRPSSDISVLIAANQIIRRGIRHAQG